VAQATTRLRCFQAGPLADRGYASAFYYWQTLPPRIETVIASSEPVNQPLLDKFGATSKGLFTLEYLLFDRPGLSQPERAKAPAALALLSGTNAQRRTAYLRAVARDVELKAGQLADDWAAPGEQGASARFAAGGHESVNLAVNQLAAAMEYEAERHLRFVLVLPKPISDQLNRIERTPSASSLQGVLESLEGGQKLFCGGDGWGLRDALKRVNAPVEKRVYDQFQAAIAATRSLGRPLEEAAANDRASLQKAFDQVRSLEILIKVDVASALGVTLTFGSNDGD
jgi:predicted lipoprotein